VGGTASNSTDIHTPVVDVACTRLTPCFTSSPIRPSNISRFGSLALCPHCVITNRIAFTCFQTHFTHPAFSPILFLSPSLLTCHGRVCTKNAGDKGHPPIFACSYYCYLRAAALPTCARIYISSLQHQPRLIIFGLSLCSWILGTLPPLLPLFIAVRILCDILSPNHHLSDNYDFFFLTCFNYLYINSFILLPSHASFYTNFFLSLRLGLCFMNQCTCSSHTRPHFPFLLHHLFLLIAISVSSNVSSPLHFGYRCRIHRIHTLSIHTPTFLTPRPHLCLL
jgi:hypothetical protein